jgi:hypothetical protein
VSEIPFLLAHIAFEKRGMVSGIPALLIGHASRADKTGRKITPDSLHCVSLRFKRACVVK